MKITIYVGNSRTIHVKGIESDLQAEEWIIKTVQNTKIGNHATMWTLTDGFGPRCIWSRPDDSRELPEVLSRSKRYSGNWKITRNEFILEKKYKKPILCISPFTRHHFGWAPMTADEI